MSTELLSTLLAANIAASAAIVLVMLIRKPVRQMIGARLSYWLWLIPVLAGLATLLPARDAGTVPSPAAPIQPIAEATVQFATAWTAPQAASPAQAGFDLALLIACLWAGGVFCSLALMLLQQQRTLRALKLTPGNPKAANNFGPAVVGVLKPLLVVPADFEQRFSPSERALVLAHEDVHLAAGHTRINAVLVVLTSLNWFNPLVHLAAKLARDDQELACDATVLERFPRQRGVYAEALLKTQISATPLPLGCTWPSRSSSFFKERLTMLANKTPSRARRMAGAGFVALALLGAGFAAWAQKPPVPAFTGAKVNVDKDGGITWEGKAVDLDALKAQVKTQATSPAPNMQISADPATPYSKVGKVFQEGQKGGIAAFKFMPSGVVVNTPRPPPPGMPAPGTRPPPPPPTVSEMAVIEKAKPDPNATPKPKAPAVPMPYPIPEPVRVFIDFDGGIYFVVREGDAKRTTIPELEKAFKEQASAKIPPEVHIEPHRLADYAAVEQVIALADKSGLHLIGVIGGI
jgi:beta-lactamase regulating signal transducer with metallopeptidase domain/biopolymer transport protein ExbD